MSDLSIWCRSRLERRRAGFHPDENRREESRWIGRCSARDTAAGV